MRIEGRQNGMIDNVPKGWLCPVCGRVYAPSVKQCSHCGEPVQAEKTEKPVMVKSGFVDVGRKCHKCGGPLLWHENIILTTYTPQYEYWCSQCGDVHYETVSENAQCSTGGASMTIEV